MTVHIGVNPILWSNDDLRELGGETPLESCLAEARQVGFQGIELGHKFPREAGMLRATLAPFGLACISGWYSAALLRRDAQAELAALRPHLDLLKAMNCPVLIVAETSNAVHGDMAIPLSRRPVLESDDWAEFGRKLTTVAEATLAEGVRLVYHHHMGTVVQSGQDIAALMAATGSAVHLVLDTGHAVFAGVDPTALATQYRERISHVHAKDVRREVCLHARESDWSFLRAVREGVFTVPGDGMIDYVSVFRGLRGYSGWIVLEAEQDPKKANPLKYATAGYGALTRFLAKGLIR